MQLHAQTPNFEIWCPRNDLAKLNYAAFQAIIHCLGRCADSLKTLFAVDEAYRILERALACVATDDSIEAFQEARGELLHAFTSRMELLRRQGLFNPRLKEDGMPWCPAVRGPFLDVTDPALITLGLALPSVTLQSRCQTVSLTIRRSRDFFPEYKRMVDEPHHPAIVLQFWLAATDSTRLERHRDELDALAATLTTQLGTVLHTHRRPVAECF